MMSRGAGASPFTFPVAVLNVGSDVPANPSGGRRTWMEVGTYYSYDTDHMYTGLLDMGNNRKDAIVNFGDDPENNGESGDQSLRFIFTQYPELPASTDPYDARRTQGLEIARMSANGNMGIGNLFTAALQPVRRLEIVDDDRDHFLHLKGPQLRLTNVQATVGNTLTTGIWTDFQTTSAGDLYINPRITGVNRNVGINISNPGNTLTIESNATSPTTSVDAGLRFMDLTTASTINTNPFGTTKGVLSVDAQGDVILVKDKDGDVTGACFTTSYVPRMTTTNTIGCSQIFDDLATVGIGVGTGVDNAYQITYERRFFN